MQLSDQQPRVHAVPCAQTMVKLLDYSRRTSGRAAVSRHQTEFVGFGIKVISFVTHPISLSPMTRAGQTTPYHPWLSLPFGSFSKNRLKSFESRVYCSWYQHAPKRPIEHVKHVRNGDLESYFVRDETMILVIFRVLCAIGKSNCLSG